MIVEDDARRRIGLEHDMIVLAVAGAIGRGVIDIIAELAALAFGIDAHAARHAQMDHQGLAAVELGQDVFGAARAAAAPCGPSSRSAKSWRKGHAQIAAPRLDIGDGMAFQRGHKAQADGLDFGQFGHARSNA